MQFRNRFLSPCVGGLFLSACVPALFSQVPNVPLTTLAGNGSVSTGCFLPLIPSFPPFAALTIPTMGPVDGVAVDSSGRLFVSDLNSNCVYRLDADGGIRVQIGFSNPPFRAGDGNHGFVDNTDAALGEFYGPQGLAVDKDGNLLIADVDNNRIRKVNTTTWTISTVAGGGNSRPFDGMLATSVALLFPHYVAADRLGNFFFSDNTSKVYKVDTNGVITKIAGSGGFSYDGEGGDAVSANMIPMQIAVDDAGNVFIADWANSIIRKVDIHGKIFTVAGNPFNVTGLGDGNPAAFGATLNGPRGVALDTLGDIFIADTGNQRIRMVDTSGIIHTIAGNGIPGFTTGQVNNPLALAVDNLGNIFIADSGNGALRALINNPRQYQLTINTTGTGSGVLAGPGLYSVGQFATVTATANPGSTFSGWSGPNADECNRGTVWMNLDKSCTANFTAVPQCAADVSSLTKVTHAGFSLNPTTQRFYQSVTITNTSASAITGPISLVVDGLPGYASVFNASGIASCELPNSPFVNNAANLAPGASMQIILQFTDPTRGAISYTTRVLAGAGTR